MIDAKFVRLRGPWPKKKAKPRRARKQKYGRGSIGIIGGSGLYTMAGLERHARGSRENAIWRSVGRARGGSSKGGGWRFWRGMGAGTAFADGDQLSGQHSRHEAARRGADYFGERGGLAARGSEAARFSDPGPIFRPHTSPRFHFFSVAESWRMWASTSRSARTRRSLGRRLRRRRESRASRRHVCLHGGPAIFHPGGIACAPPIAFDMIGMTN